MISKTFAKRHIGAEPGFQWRGDDITRIEGLSDAVFAFAVTLLVVSLEVPKTFDELYLVMRGLPAFAVSFLLLMFVWYDQYTFFRRYGINDFKTLALTIAQLFLILFYIYPLKFLWSALLSPLSDLLFPLPKEAEKQYFSSAHDVAFLMTLYHIGIMAVYVTFSLLYYHAYSKREELSLNIVELHDTKESIVNSLFFVCLGLTGMLLIIIGGDEMAGLSGMIYPVIIAPFFSIMGAISRKKRDKLLAQLQAG
jgi:uncharacterized membrane protein